MALYKWLGGNSGITAFMGTPQEQSIRLLSQRTVEIPEDEQLSNWIVANISNKKLIPVVEVSE